MMEEFWGKARAPGLSAHPTHSILGHSLDVAAVAVLLPRGPGLSLPGRAIGALAGLHDVGKFSRNFQAKAPDYWPAASLGPLPPNGGGLGVGHDTMGLYLLRDPLRRLLEPLLPERAAHHIAWDSALRSGLLRAITGHHGRPPETLTAAPGSDLLCDSCIAAATTFTETILRVFAPAPLPCPGDAELARWSWDLAGLLTLADWIGSRPAWFPYVGPRGVADPAAYFWDHALPRAAAAIAAAGITGSRPAPFEGMRRLFPSIATPSPVQDWAATVPLPEGPSLTVIEDLTGSGKTEAALTLAHRLMADGRAEGLFMALPSMATANAMFGRLASAYRGLFVPEGQPSLALAHGRAALDARFRASIPVDPAPATASPEDPADEPSESHCAAWLADDRRKALLAQVGVGTLDQALMAVLPVRHATLRLQALSRKILVVDEVHAFDTYMRKELARLLEFHAALGGSAVLLSATLPRATRAELVTAFRRGLRAPPVALSGTAYPLTSLVSATGLAETPCAPRPGLSRRLPVARLPDAEAALARVCAAAEAGAAVAWIRNTVDEAIAAAEELRARGHDPILFHARFAMVDRLSKEAEVLRRFGRDSAGEARRGIVVATQVIEQSLDIDFDVLVSDLAPADLLIQRAGRLWRHARPERPVAAPEFLVVAPEPVAEPPADWIAATQPGTLAVYRDAALLWRSARALFRRGMIVAPEEVRALVEEAYADEAEGAVPAALASSALRASGQDYAAADMARQNLLAFNKPYERAAGQWDPETRTPTRLEDQPRVTLRLAVLRDGAVVPYAEDPEPARAWALSEVSVAQHRVSACPVPAGLEAAAAEARAGWGRWERESERVLLAILCPVRDGTEAGTGSRVGVTTPSDAQRSASYDAMSGFRLA